jgi:GNAT superfamily N-acetyltransferase
MPQAPAMTIPFARRLAAAHETFHAEGLRAAEALPGNPFAVEVRRFGRAVATLSARLPMVDHVNRVVGLELQDARALPELLAFFRAHGIRARFEIGPAELTSALAVQLARERVGVERIETVVWAPIEALAAPQRPSEVEVRASPLDELELFLELWARGFDVPGFVWDEVTALHRAWFSLPAFHRYVARADGRPIASAGLFVHGEVGYLCVSATLPEARGRGAQAALIARRWRDAAEAGCTYVTSQTAFGGTSQHNMERAGMRCAHSLAIWLDYGMGVSG